MVCNSSYKTAASACLLLALLLMSWGNLRADITPLGYWVCWLVWAVSSVVVLWQRPSSEPRPVGPPVWVLGSYAVLLAGMFLAAVVNTDSVSAYQGVKILVIAAFFWLMWQIIQGLGYQRVFVLVRLSLIIVALGFFPFKWFHPDHFIQLDGREGYAWANVGILWKSGTLLLPLLLAGVMSFRPAPWLNGLAAGSGVYLALVDGSRTALLLLVAMAIGFALVLTIRRQWRPVVRRSGWVFLSAIVLLCFMNLNALTTPSEADSLASRTDAVLPVGLDRLSSGDPARARLMSFALDKIPQCFVLGCGFGSTISPTGVFMPVHNAYIAVLVDFGLIGLLGSLGFLVAAVIPMFKVFDRTLSGPALYFPVFAGMGAVAYALSLALHTFTSEMSEWGYVMLLLAVAWAPLASKQP